MSQNRAVPIIDQLQARIQELEAQLADCQSQLAHVSSREATFRAIAEHANDIITTISHAGDVTYLSPNVQRSVGYTPAQVEGQAFTQFIHPDDLPDVASISQQVMATAQPYSGLEYRVLHKQGHYVWHSANLSTYRDETGQPVLVAIAQDITHQKATEAALAKSEAQFEAILQNANVAIFAKDLDGRYIFANPWVTEEVGIPLEQIIGKTDADLLPADIAHMLQENDRHALETGQALRLEEVFASPAGETTYLAIKFPLCDRDGNPYAVCGISTNITDLKRTESELRASEARFNDILNGVLASIDRYRVYPDNTWQLEYFSPGSIHVWGFTPEELLADPFLLSSRVHPDDREPVIGGQFFSIVRSAGTGRLEYRHAHPHLGWRWVAVTVSSVWDKAAQCWQVTTVATDISDRKLAEAALRESEAKLNRILDTTSATIATYRVYSDRRFIPDYISSSSLQLWGFPPEEMMADLQPWIDRFEPDDLQRILAEAYDYIFNERPYSYEFRYHHPDGSLRCLECYSTCHRDEVADCWRTTVVYIDITDRKLAEAALQESEAKLNRTLDRANACIADFRVYPDRRFIGTYFSSGSVQLWGLTPEEMLADLQPWLSRYDPQDLATSLAECFDYIFNERPYTYEYRYHHPDGSLRWIQLNVTSYWDEAEGCWRTPSVSIDITDRKRAEVALLRSETRFRQIVENANDLIATTSSDGVFTYISPNVFNLVGYTDTELIGQLCTSIVHPDDIPLCFEIISRVLETGEAATLDYRLMHRDGSCRYFVVNVSMYQDEEGNPLILGISRDLTDRKRLEEDLRQSEVKFRRIVENASDLIATAIPDGTLTYISPNVSTLLGYHNTELIGGYFAPIVHPDDVQLALHAIQQVITTGTNYEYETRLVHRDGSLRYVISNVSMYEGADGNPMLLSFARDITDRKRLEEELRKSEAKFRAIVENANDMIYVIGNDGRIVYMSPNSIGLTGYAPEEMEGRSFEPFLYPEDLPIAINAVQRAIAGEKVSFETRSFYKDGRIYWTSSNVVPFQMPTGERGLMGISRDVSDRKRLEEELRQSQQFLNSVVDNIPLGFFAKDVRNEFRYVLINRYAERFMTLSRDEGLGHNDYELLPEHLADFYRQQDEAVLQQRSLVETPEVEITRHNGEQFLARVIKFPLFDDQGNLTHLLCLSDDITERKQREEELRLAKDAAEAANRAKSTFLANMSHELRTPLNVILGFTQIMERENALSDRQRNFITTINRSGEHLLNLINDVLEMSKIEAGRITLTPEPFHLLHLLHNLQEMFQIRADAKRLTLTFDLDPDLPTTVIADQGKLRQVLINLLSNAVKFTEQGEITLQVTLSSIASPPPPLPSRQSFTSVLHFTVMDTGIGIAPEEVEQLFQPFMQTTSGTQMKEGTGLGLTISRQFVQLMGGDIQLRSVVGQGSTFMFQIPITLVDEPVSAPQRHQGRVLGLVPGQPTYRLLIVDDRVDNRNLLTHLLQPLGFDIQTASNGQEAIALWQSWLPHLIWMDMRMPVMDGYDATRHIRALEQAHAANDHPPTKIIALTASAFEEQRATILAAGCDDLVRKPFREQLIFDKLTEHLGVQFIYTETASLERQNIETLRADAFQVMPPEWIQALHRAAIALDDDWLLQLIAEIPPEHAIFADQLRKLISCFDFDAILELIGRGESDA
jgi:PAS domain S-box-containing protein